MTALVKVPFEGDELHAVKQDGSVWVSIRRVCEALGVSLQGQHEKLSSKPWATIKFILTVAEDGKDRQMSCIDLDSLPMWLATIEPSRVAPEVRPKLEQYQREAARVLRDHFFGAGGAGGSPLRNSSAELAKEEVSRRPGPDLTTAAGCRQSREERLRIKAQLEQATFMRDSAGAMAAGGAPREVVMGLHLAAVETALGRPLPVHMLHPVTPEAPAPARADTVCPPADNSCPPAAAGGEPTGLERIREGGRRGGIKSGEVRRALSAARSEAGRKGGQKRAERAAALATAIRAAILEEVATAPAPITSWDELSRRVQLGSRDERWNVMRALLRERLLIEVDGRITLSAQQ